MLSSNCAASGSEAAKFESQIAKLQFQIPKCISAVGLMLMLTCPCPNQTCPIQAYHVLTCAGRWTCWTLDVLDAGRAGRWTLVDWTLVDWTLVDWTLVVDWTLDVGRWTLLDSCSVTRGRARLSIFPKFGKVLARAAKEQQQCAELAAAVECALSQASLSKFLASRICECTLISRSIAFAQIQRFATPLFTSLRIVASRTQHQSSGRVG